MAVGDEMLLVQTATDRQRVTHINLNSCDSRTEEFGGPVGASLIAGAKSGAARKKSGRK